MPDYPLGSMERLTEAVEKLNALVEKLLEVPMEDGHSEEGHPSPGDEFAASIRTMDDA